MPEIDKMDTIDIIWTYTDDVKKSLYEIILKSQWKEDSEMNLNSDTEAVSQS